MLSKAKQKVEGSNTDLEVVAMRDMRDMVSAEMFDKPKVGHITNSKQIHVGHKFVSITQKVENTEMVKAYPFPQYVWNVARNSTRAERLACTVAVAALLLCTVLVAYFTAVARSDNIDVVDRAPHEWNITREMWLARTSPNNVSQEEFSPIKLVIIQHSVSPECHRFKICAAELRNLQNYFLDSPNLGWDLPYNFAIGNDGRVYRIRDWNQVGAHTVPYNRCSVGIGFIGDYQDAKGKTQVTDLQLKRLNMILQEGVDRGYLRPDYSIVGAIDMVDTISPGATLYRALQTLDHYDNTNYRGVSCEKIYKNLTRLNL